MAPIHTFLTAEMLFSSSKSWKQVHDVEADICLNETIHKGWRALTLRAGGPSDCSGGDCPLERVTQLELAHLLQKDGHDTVTFLGAQRSERWETPHPQDTMTKAGQPVRFDPPPTVT